jgi:hypothetical protein
MKSTTLCKLQHPPHKPRRVLRLPQILLACSTTWRWPHWALHQHSRATFIWLAIGIRKGKNQKQMTKVIKTVCREQPWRSLLHSLTLRGMIWTGGSSLLMSKGYHSWAYLCCAQRLPCEHAAKSSWINFISELVTFRKANGSHLASLVTEHKLLQKLLLFSNQIHQKASSRPSQWWKLKLSSP